MESKRKKLLPTLIIFSLVGQIAWVVENMYFNVFIYNMFGASAENISTMVALSAVTATVTTLLIGALSDKVGKRKLFICGGKKRSKYLLCTGNKSFIVSGQLIQSGRQL